jgi:hypothetical protein
LLVAFNLKKMRTKYEIKEEINRLESKIRSEKAFLRSCEEISFAEADNIDDDIYIMGKELKMLKWVLN